MFLKVNVESPEKMVSELRGEKHTKQGQGPDGEIAELLVLRPSIENYILHV